MKRYILPLLALIVLLGLMIPEWLMVYSHPTSHQIDNFPLLSQPDEITCGPTSALMVLKHYGKDVSLDDVKHQTKTEWFVYDGHHIGMTSPDYISRAMRYFGVPATMRSGTLPKLKHYVSEGKPVIVLLRSGKLTWHYVAVVGCDEQSVTLADPGGGVRWAMTNNQFLGAWSFKTDMEGNEVVGSCGPCGGTGRWLKWDLGPLSYCEACGGSGKQPDYVGAALRAADVYPMTMVVPK